MLTMVLAASCSGGSPSQDAPTTAEVSASDPVPTASESAMTGVAARCGLPQNDAASAATLAGPGGSKLPLVSLGTGPTVAVFLHQTDGDGLCGWWPYANWLTKKERVRAVLVDLCGYGEATCDDEAFSVNQTEQVVRTVEWARSHGATRVVVVGASMGGALALGTTEATAADAVVDLSGPADWQGVRSAPASMRSAQVPTLVAISEETDPDDYAVLKRSMATMPGTAKKFISVDSGHGWSMLGDPGVGTVAWNSLARDVADWIVGD